MDQGSVRRALINPRITGRSVYRGTDLGAGDWPAILDADTFAQVEERLNDPRRRTAFNTSARHLLSGIARCGVCDGPMYGSPMKSRERRWMVYRCHDRHVMRRMDLVDEVVEGVIVARLARPDALALLSPDVDLDALRERARDLRERRDNLAALLAEGLLSAASVREQAGKISTELREVEGRIDGATGDNPALTVASSADAAAAWEALALESRRAVVKALVSVTVERAGKGARFSPEQVRIEWKV
ncbi:hypothetical protein N866_01825 [Actinotalea ferrariae CF5-4]|uniref:Recombinase zinc beta ribbon domain-containing protein n=1 Tax=Actinotalea ferrariae CF5-4 TaxID=948458 RepID=A0A021VQ22_9CELL|nr:hypothetical protein N866_01825 [Actinotalea ferrariae CF5-4]